MPIYGIPVEVGGSWTEDQRSTWKTENCSSADMKNSFEAATLRYLQTASPIIAGEWGACMAARAPINSAIECEITRVGESTVFVARWLRSVGDDKPPTVLSWVVSGGVCQPALARGEEFSEAPRQVVCQRHEKQDFVAMLETQRGSCWKPVPYEPTEVVLSGRIVLTGPQTYRSEVIEFQPVTELVTNGHHLAIVAESEIVVAGDARIRSFGAREENPDVNGRSASSILIQAPGISGGVLHIENFGEDGLKPGPVPLAAKGRPGAPGQGGIWKNLQGCVERREAGTGGQGAIGSKGNTGGYGGNGGDVTINIAGGVSEGELRHVNFTTTRGGAPGASGDPGQGGEGGDGGHSAGPRSNFCDGVGPGNIGPEGDWGPPGDPGQPGKAGAVVELAG